jgi:hypothetical protein
MRDAEMRIAPPVVLDSSRQETLKQWAGSRSLPARQVERAKVVLLAAAGRTDLRFFEQLEDIVGLYLNPPEHALVMCVDEKSQIQALDRTQPGLPLKKGHCGTMTHDYKRNGTATLFAALNPADGTVISMCDDRHRHEEWFQFLPVIDQVTPAGKALHLITDNYSTQKHVRVLRRLKRHPRFHVHFTPTSSS